MHKKSWYELCGDLFFMHGILAPYVLQTFKLGKARLHVFYYRNVLQVPTEIPII